MEWWLWSGHVDPMERYLVKRPWVIYGYIWAMVDTWWSFSSKRPWLRFG
jgi:hypothetical protein